MPTSTTSSIKWEPTLFPIFKHHSLWGNWNRNTIAAVCTQDVHNILTKPMINQIPVTLTCSERGKCMHSVFFRALLTGKRNKIVREHQSDKDSRVRKAFYTCTKIYRDFPIFIQSTYLYHIELCWR